MSDSASQNVLETLLDACRRKSTTTLAAFIASDIWTKEQKAELWLELSGMLLRLGNRQKRSEELAAISDEEVTAVHTVPRWLVSDAAE